MNRTTPVTAQAAPQLGQAVDDPAAQVRGADLVAGLLDAYHLGEVVEPAHRGPHVDARPGHVVPDSPG
jgi:hypothetical protein